MDEIKKMLSSKVAKNGGWLVILQIFNTVVPMLTLPYVTRILSTSDYGQFSIALNWVGYLQVIVEYGFGLTGARKVAMRKSDNELSHIQSSIIYARMLLCTLSVIILGGLCFLPSIGFSQVICMWILFLMVVAVVFQQTWFFQGISEMRNITVINMISRVISVVLIFILVKKPEDLYLYCLLYISNFAIAALFGLFVSHRKYGVRFQKVKLSDVVSEIKDGWYLFISSAMSKVFSSIGVTILTLFVTSSTIGIYSAINKIPYMMTILFSAVSQALYPFMCKQFSISFSKGVSTVKQVAKYVMIPFMALGVGIILLNKPIVTIAFGEEYATMSLLLVPFVVWMLMSILNNFLGVQILVASGAQKEYSKAFQISTIAMLLFMLLLGWGFGAYGVACAPMLSEVLLTVILIIAIRKKSTERKVME